VGARLLLRVKVLFLTTNYPRPELPIDGIFVREHARAAALANDVAVVHLDRSPARRGLFEAERIAGEDPPAWRVRYRRYGRPVSYAAFVLGTLSALRRLRRTGFAPDIIHANSFLSALPALMIGRLYRIPVVYTEHWTIFLSENPGTLSPSMLRAARYVLQHVDVVLPVSASLARALATLAPTARFEVVPNVVDERVFYPPTNRNPGSERRLLTAGLMDTGRKGIDVLLDAVASADTRNTFRLDIVGDGSKRVEYERRAHRLGLESKITFHGLRSKPELAELMRRSDLFVLASRYENNPCVALEAMATGLPLVATRVGGIPELVGPEVGLLAEPEDPASFAARIDEALDRDFDHDAIARISLDSYGSAAVGARLVEIYDALAASKKTRAASR
jgi:glycosyltransferase involved in cell wall biosynthesis